MKFDYEQIHHEEVENVCMWIKNTFDGEIMKKDIVIHALLIHIFASLRNIEMYCIDSLEDKYDI